MWLLGGGESRWKVGGDLVGKKKERKREVVACLVWSPNTSKVQRFPRFLMFVFFIFFVLSWKLTCFPRREKLYFRFWTVSDFFSF